MNLSMERETSNNQPSDYNDLIENSTSSFHQHEIVPSKMFSLKISDDAASKLCSIEKTRKKTSGRLSSPLLDGVFQSMSTQTKKDELATSEIFHNSPSLQSSIFPYKIYYPDIQIEQEVIKKTIQNNDNVSIDDSDGDDNQQMKYHKIKNISNTMDEVKDLLAVTTTANSIDEDENDIGDFHELSTSPNISFDIPKEPPVTKSLQHTHSKHSESPPLEYVSKSFFSKVLKDMEQLRSVLVNLSDDVEIELQSSSCFQIDSISERFRELLDQFDKISAALSEESRARDIWLISQLPGSPIDSAAYQKRDLTIKVDDLLSRLKEATSLPTEALTTRLSEWQPQTEMGGNVREQSCDDEIEKQMVEKLSVVTDAINNEVVQLEKEICQLREELAKKPLFGDILGSSQVITNEIEEARIKRKWLEAMQKGTWFFRVSRKYGALGLALRALRRRRVFIRLSPDFRCLSISNSEPNSQDVEKNTKNKKPTTVALDSVESFEYGSRSRAFRLVEDSRIDTEHPVYLCLSFRTSKVTIDLIALNEPDVERWVLGLNCLIPFFPGRQFFTPSEFNKKKTALRHLFLKNLDLRDRSAMGATSIRSVEHDNC